METEPEWETEWMREVKRARREAEGNPTHIHQSTGGRGMRTKARGKPPPLSNQFREGHSVCENENRRENCWLEEMRYKIVTC